MKKSENNIRLSKRKFMYKLKNKLKKNPTKAEILFREKLTEAGIKFKFQKVFLNKYKGVVMDFYFKTTDKKRFNIEIDGEYHLTKDQIEKDRKRTEWLARRRKTTVIRFSNQQVFSDVDSIVKKIFELKPVMEIPTPFPPPQKEL